MPPSDMAGQKANRSTGWVHGTGEEQGLWQGGGDGAGTKANLAGQSKREKKHICCKTTE